MNHRNALAYALFLVTLLVAGGFALFVSRSMTDSATNRTEVSVDESAPDLTESPSKNDEELSKSEAAPDKESDESSPVTKDEQNSASNAASNNSPEQPAQHSTSDQPTAPAIEQGTPVNNKPWFYANIGKSGANGKEVEQQQSGQKFTLVLKESAKLPEIRKSLADLQKRNIHAFLGSYKLKNKSIYRVQYGVFISKRKAKEAQEALKVDYDLSSSISEMDEPQ